MQTFFKHFIGQMEIVSNEHRLALLEDAQNVWENGILQAKSSFKIDPTAYLKLFQLDNPGRIFICTVTN